MVLWSYSLPSKSVIRTKIVLKCCVMVNKKQTYECCSKCLFLVLDTYTLLPQTTAVAYASLRHAGFSKVLLFDKHVLLQRLAYKDIVKVIMNRLKWFLISTQNIFDIICWFCNLAWFLILDPLILVSLIFNTNVAAIKNFVLWLCNLRNETCFD